ncbi:Potassium voltage-gated channel protein Shal [Taenia crassiceps]|uniref:Potassium voltage-gated channel protein Shal n=1 Tax=Taenia crassiceps TaxID=6207 RepID=A0ABR4QGX7_9CEST
MGWTPLLTNSLYQLPNPEDDKGNLEKKTRINVSEREYFYNEITEEYFFDRDPQVFRYILNYYRTGRLHFPRSECVFVYEEELNFFGIRPDALEICCYEDFMEKKKEDADRYGDIVPVTVMGKIFGGICSLSGVLVIALPVPVIVSNFARIYQQSQQADKKMSQQALKIARFNVLAQEQHSVFLMGKRLAEAHLNALHRTKGGNAECSSGDSEIVFDHVGTRAKWLSSKNRGLLQTIHEELEDTPSLFSQLTMTTNWSQTKGPRKTWSLTIGAFDFPDELC